VLVHLDAGPKAFILLIVDHVVLAHGDHTMRLNGVGHRDPHDPGEIGAFGEVLKISTGDRGPMQAHARALENVLAQRRGFRTDDVAVGVREVRVETSGEADGHRQGCRRRTRSSVAHADAHRAVGDPETGNPQLIDGLDVPLNPDLGGKLIHIRPGLPQPPW
jgi:hypothetical protein